MKSEVMAQKILNYEKKGGKKRFKVSSVQGGMIPAHPN